MTVVSDPGKYLGLPSVWGRSKCAALSFLESKIVSKLQGWGLITNQPRKRSIDQSGVRGNPYFCYVGFQASEILVQQDKWADCSVLVGNVKRRPENPLKAMRVNDKSKDRRGHGL